MKIYEFHSPSPDKTRIYTHIQIEVFWDDLSKEAQDHVCERLHLSASEAKKCLNNIDTPFASGEIERISYPVE